VSFTVRVVFSALESLPRTSSLRKALDSVQDAKYEGIKSSRSALLEDSGNEDGSDGEVSTQGSPALENENGYPSSGEENASSDRSASLSASSSAPKASALDSGASETLEKIREDDRAKGKAVWNQTVSRPIDWLM
jgi:protein AATF/BFR2